MGLRCSLLGHDYGESFVERDREERGNEVVVTERELQECARCGAEKVSSENTEVRSLDPDPEPSPSPDAADAGQPDDSPADAGQPADSPADAGGAFTSATDAIEQAESGTDAGPSTTAAEADVAAEGDDDAVILEEDADDATPGSDQWEEPDETDVDPGTADEPPAHTPDPDDEDVEFVDAGPDADAAGTPGTGAESATPDPAADDSPTDAGAPEGRADDSPASAGQPAGQSASQSTGQSAGQSADAAGGRPDRSRGEWPDHDGEDEGFDAQPADDPADAAFEFGDDGGDQAVVEADTGFTSAGPVDQSETDDLDFTLFCPECGFEQYAGGSSLRAGDICPECKRGYLAEDR